LAKNSSPAALDSIEHHRIPIFVLHLHLHPHFSPVMASRRLALNLQQGLRAQRAINAVRPNITRRALATPVSHASTTESTTLSNGFTVCGY
jgi:processing peptidase subunit beta